jgi:hypothetical protein
MIQEEEALPCTCSTIHTVYDELGGGTKDDDDEEALALTLQKQMNE